MSLLFLLLLLSLFVAANNGLNGEIPNEIQHLDRLEVVVRAGSIKEGWNLQFTHQYNNRLTLLCFLTDRLIDPLIGKI
jgi:hypothetical protein